MCMPHMDNGETYTTCECPTTCSAESEPVCSFYHKQFNSRCEMHKYACAHDLTMKVKNEGNCLSDSKYHKCCVFYIGMCRPIGYGLFYYHFYAVNQFTLHTVKPVLSGPVLNGHPLLSGQLQKSRKVLLLTTLNVTSIKRSPLLSGRDHLLQSPSEGISTVFTCIKRSLH